MPLSKVMGNVTRSGMLLCASLVLVGAVEAQSDGPRAPTDGRDLAYRVGPEDVLEISVWREEGLQKEVLVRPDGGISFPLAGDLQVGGKTVGEIQTAVTERVRAYVPGAVVTVSAKSIAGYRIFVIGQVNEPGQYVVGRYIDVVQALALAGGMTPFAKESKIKIIRRGEGREQVFPFDYTDIKAGRRLAQNLRLRSGDVVVVP